MKSITKASITKTAYRLATWLEWAQISILNIPMCCTDMRVWINDITHIQHAAKPKVDVVGEQVVFNEEQ